MVAADKAAVAADRYARLMRSPQEHYQVHLAGEAEWQTWFGGGPTTTAVGYQAPAGIAGTEVVLRTAKLSDGYLLETVQHELGHVVTLNGVELEWKVSEAHGWLIEGVAEYVAFAPRPATANSSHAHVVTATKLPDTIAVPALGAWPPTRR